MIALQPQRVTGTASAMAGWQCKASAVTTHPFSVSVFNNARVPATSLPPGARHAAIETRVSASHTLTIKGDRQDNHIIVIENPNHTVTITNMDGKVNGKKSVTDKGKLIKKDIVFLMNQGEDDVVPLGPPRL